MSTPKIAWEWHSLQQFRENVDDCDKQPIFTRITNSVPSKVRKCAAPPDHLRSEILLSRICNTPNLIACIYRIALSPLETLHCLCFCMVAQLHAHQNKYFHKAKFG